MKKKSLNKYMRFYFYTNWKLILFIFCMWSLISIAILIISCNSYYNFSKPVFNDSYETGQGGFFKRNSITFFDHYFLYGPVFIFLYLIVTVVFLNIIFYNEVNSEIICYWLTQGLSKTQIIIYKLIFIWLLSTFLFLIESLISLVFICESYLISGKEIEGYFIQSLNFLCIIYFLNVATFFIFILLIDHQYLANSLIFCFLIYTIIIIVLDLFLKTNFLKYFNILNLAYDPFWQNINLDQSSAVQITNKNGDVLTVNSWKKINMLPSIIISFFLLTTTCGFCYPFVKVYNKKDMLI
ncbi:hypothetical protein [Spiroplasma endosymbiont of Aspidapion aeneum]|uniref:hypothetical protein n=1 Tax=Spiroplasma endosymbiont of Aspidapion aeneum TaxID=3066276 RepID=UPI00313BB18F